MPGIWTPTGKATPASVEQLAPTFQKAFCTLPHEPERSDSAPHLRGMVLAVCTKKLRATQAVIQGFEWTHPNIYHIYDLLQYVKGMIL